jgi:hypothetical protein
LTLTFFTITLLLALHTFADFILQTREQARNKSSNNKALAAHVLTYISAFVIWAFFTFDPETALVWLVLNAVAHFVTDYITSRVTKTLAEQWQNPMFSKEDRHIAEHLFWGVVGVDQFIHLFTLFGSAIAFGAL